MTKKNITKKQTGVRLDAENLKALKHIAVDTGRSLNSLMDEALEDILKKYSKHSAKR